MGSAIASFWTGLHSFLTPSASQRLPGRSGPSSPLQATVILVLGASVLFAAGCDSTGPSPDPGESTTLEDSLSKSFRLFNADLVGVWQSGSSIADVNGDGNPDILLAGADSTLTPTAALYFGNGDGSFSKAQIDPTGIFVKSSTSIEDVNGDGHPDLFLTGDDVRNAPLQELFLGDGTGSFTKADIDLEGGEGGQSSFADFNNDGRPDLLITGREGGYLLDSRVYLGNGDGTFSKIDTDLPGNELGSHSIGDVNEDGIPDLFLTGAGATSNGGFFLRSALFLGNGDGTFTKTNVGLPPTRGSSTSIADVDGDGHLDLLISGKKRDGDLFTALYFGNGDGSFARANAGLVDVWLGDNAIGDVNGDGTPDLLITGIDADENPVTTLYLGEGDGTFSEADAGLFGAGDGSVSIADVDQDQDQDLLITGETTALADSAVPASILYENTGDWDGTD